jgi:cyclic-di-AMP phosphodiesterase PgpH
MAVIIQVLQWFQRCQAAAGKIPTRPLVVIVTVILIVVLFPFSSTKPVFDLPREGEIATETILAPFTFDVEKTPQELDFEKKRAASRVFLVLDYHQEVTLQTRRRLLELRSKLAAVAATSEQTNPHSADVSALSKELSETTIRTLKKTPRLIDAAITEATVALEKGVLGVRLVFVDRNQSETYGSALVKGADLRIPYDKEIVTLRRNRAESNIPMSDIPGKEQALETIIRNLKNTGQFDDAGLNSVYEMLVAYIQPNVVINNEETDRRKEKATQEVLPIKGKVLKETELVRTHQVVTTDILEKLYSLRKAQQEMDASGELARTRGHYIGNLLLITIALLFLVFFISRFYKEVVRENKNIMAIACILVVQIALIRLGVFMDTKLLQSINGAASMATSYIIPTSLAAILSAILFDIRLSFAISIFVSIYFGVAQGASFQMFIVSVLTGFVAGYFTKNIRYRFDFIKAIPPILAVYCVVIFILDLVSFKFSTEGLLQNWGLASINCVISIILAMVLTMLFEHMFDIATSMTLIELSDMNHPVLKRLSIEAAGTYNHSVLVGNLAESAAQRIGANSLFVRVASYYHDIGKIEKADYFIENMMNHERSKHAKLSPNLSALLISSHVKDGVELAKRHKLPGAIREAILQHHGNSTVSFFFEKALEQDPHKQVREEQFRYPGPLPQTRENAIIMLADAVEAASRSLATSSPKLLRDLVKKVIRDKFTSAQLDQSNLTLRDLDEIVEGFMPILQGIFHTRVITSKEKR